MEHKTGLIVMIESPYSGDIDRNVRYLALVSLEAAVIYNELPYASHACMTQHPRHVTYFVSDYDPKWDGLTREQAIEMSQRMRLRCDKTVFYTDLGWSSGMKMARQFCQENNLPYEERQVNAKRLAEHISFCSEDFTLALIQNQEYKNMLSQ